ncbi:MAG: hypothetical protein ACRD5E_04705 [Nitrososphaeraceae archaeon]
MDTIEELDRNRELASTALKEKLTDARKDRPEMLDEITVIERALEMIEDVDNYVERFNELEVLVRSFLADAESQPPNIPNTDRLNRLTNIRDDLNVYKNAYANYAVGLLSKKEGD